MNPKFESAQESIDNMPNDFDLLLLKLDMERVTANNVMNGLLEMLNKVYGELEMVARELKKRDETGQAVNKQKAAEHVVKIASKMQPYYTFMGMTETINLFEEVLKEK